MGLACLDNYIREECWRYYTHNAFGVIRNMLLFGVIGARINCLG